MKAAICQYDIVWGDPEANHKRLIRFLDEAAGCDLFVLPEMFSTGYSPTDASVSEMAPYPSLEWMKAQAAARDMAIVGSVAVQDGEKFYNRLFFVCPDTNVTVYDKHHLFTYSGEHKHFTPGNERRIIEYRGVRFLLTVCYDLRFPVWLRCTDEYDAIVNCADWPIPRRFAWDTLLRARAIENQCFVLASNRCGTDKYCVYNGGSAIIGPYGQTIAAAADTEESVIIAELDMEALRSFRSKTPVLSEADRFEILYN